MANRVIIKGNICNDLELKESGETKILSFNVAVQRKFKNKNGEYETDFFRVSAFNQQAVFISTYFSKGSQIFVEGRLQTRTYDKDGETRYATDIIAEQVEFCGTKRDNSSQPQTQQEPISDMQFENQAPDVAYEPLPF